MSIMMLVKMQRHSSLFPARRTAYPTSLLPAIVVSLSKSLILCLPLALAPSIMPSKHSVSRLFPLNTWPRYVNCLCRIVFISFLVVPAIRKTYTFVLNILLKSHISVASRRFCICLDIVQISHTRNNPDQMYHLSRRVLICV